MQATFSQILVNSKKNVYAIVLFFLDFKVMDR